MNLFHRFHPPVGAGPKCDVCDYQFREDDDIVTPRQKIKGVNRLCWRCAKAAEDEFYKPLVAIFERMKGRLK